MNITVNLTIGNGNFRNTWCDGNDPKMKENSFDYNPSVFLDIVHRCTLC